MEHCQTAADGLYILNDMGGQEDQPFFCRNNKEVSEPSPLLRVQSDGGLVKNQKRRIAKKRLRDACSLALPAGQGADSDIFMLFQMNRAKSFSDSFFRMGYPF